MNQDLEERLLYKEQLMLIRTRKPGQSFKIQPAADLPLTMLVGALFVDGPIEIVVQRPLLPPRRISVGRASWARATLAVSALHWPFLCVLHPWH